MTRSLRLSSLSLTLLLPLAASAASWFGGAEVNAYHDDNINRAADGGDVETDSTLDLRLNGGRFQELGTAGSLTLLAELRGALHQQFEALNAAGLQARVDYRHKLGLGHFAPWVSVGASAGYDDFDDDNRDASLYGVSARAGKRFRSLPNWTFSADLAWEQRSAGEPDTDDGNAAYKVFDSEALSLSLSADYTLEGGALLFGGYAWRDGDITSSTSDMPDWGSTPYLEDPVFEMRTYRLDATSHIFSLGANMPLSDRSSWSLVFQHQRVEPRNWGGNYAKNLLRANYLWSF